MEDDFRMLKSVIHAVITGVTAGEGVGLKLYLANGDLTLVEVEQAIEVNGPLNRQDRVNNEHAMRAVFLVGAADGAGDQVFRDINTNAPVLVAKPRWTFGASTSWNWVVHNSGIVLTTGATINIHAIDYGVWVGA